jgi:hypothetical protein
MTSDAEKLFDEIDALYVRLRGLREVRRDLVEQTSRLDIEIGEVRLKLTQKHDAFQRLDNASIESAARTVPGADADPRAGERSTSPSGGSDPNMTSTEFYSGTRYNGLQFTLHPLTDKGAAALEKVRARLPHTGEV